MNDLFLSYARKDDEPFVHKLYEHLTAEGLEVWFDRKKMPNRGLEFSAEIKRAVLESKRLALIVGPAALSSDYVEKEWRTAVEATDCIPVIPLMRIGDYSDLPSELKMTDAPDFRDNAKFDHWFDYLLRQLTDDMPPPAELHGLRWFGLPRGYVRRHGLWKILDEAVRGDDISAQVATSREQITALQGMAGLGKTVMAAAYAHDCAVRRTFDSGIHWLAADRTATTFQLHVNLAQQLGIDTEDFTPDNCTQKVAALLAGKRTLIVIDDVWSRDIIDGFRPVLSDDSRLLFTTRQTRLVTLTQAQRVEVETLAIDEGVRLIGRWQDRPAANDTSNNPNLDAERAIVETLDGHTLAVNLAAARIAEVGPDYAPTLLAEYQAAKTGDSPFVDLELAEDDRNWNVEVSLKLSYHALSEVGQTHFRQLGVIAENASFGSQMTAAVWDEAYPNPGLSELEGAALLDKEPDGRYLQHTILRAYATALLRRGDDVAHSATRDRYEREVHRIAKQMQAEDQGGLPLEEWDDKVGPDFPHIDALGMSLVAEFREWWGDRETPGPATCTTIDGVTVDLSTLPGHEPILKTLAAPQAEAPTVAAHDPIRDRFLKLNRLLTRSGVGNYIAYRSIDERGLDWQRLGLVAARVLDDQESAALGMNSIAVWLRNRGYPYAALAYYEKALPINRQIGDRASEGTTLNNIGRVYVALGVPHKALEHFKQALTIMREANYRWGESIALNNIGGAYHALAEEHESEDYFRQALDCYEQALVVRREVGNRVGEGTTLNNIGSIHLALGQTQKGLDYYLQALDIRRAVGDLGGEGLSLNNVASAHIALGQKDKALEYLEQALTILQAVGDRETEATTLHNIGTLYEDMGDTRKAIQYIEQALALSRAIGSRIGEEIIHEHLRSVGQHRGEKDKSLESYKQALSRSRETSDRIGEAAALSHLASAHNDLGDRRKALDYYEQALAIQRELVDRAGEISTLKRIGAIHYALGDKQKELESYEQLLPATRVVGDRASEADVLNSLGRTCDILGQKRKALNYHLDALPIAKEVGSRESESTALNNIGTLYHTLGDTPRAVEYFEQAIPILRELGDQAGEATAMMNTGVMYLSQGQTERALDNCQKAYVIAQAIGDRKLEAAALNGIGRLHDVLGDSAKALDCYEKVLPIRREVGDRAGEAVTFNNIALVHSARGDQRKALEYYQRALHIMVEAGDIMSEAGTCHNVAMIYQDLGDLDKSIEYMERSVRLCDEMGIPDIENDRTSLAQLRRQRGSAPSSRRSGLASFFRKKESTPSPRSRDDGSVLHHAPSHQSGAASPSGQAPGAASSPQRSLIPPLRKPTALGTATVEGWANDIIAAMSGDNRKHRIVRRWFESHRKDLKRSSMSDEVAFTNALIDILDGKTPSLPVTNPYMEVVQAVMDIIKNPHGTAAPLTSGSHSSRPASPPQSQPRSHSAFPPPPERPSHSLPAASQKPIDIDRRAVLAVLWAAGTSGLRNYLRDQQIPENLHDRIIANVIEMANNEPPPPTDGNIDMGKRELLAAFQYGGESGFRAYLRKRGIPDHHHGRLIPVARDLAANASASGPKPAQEFELNDRDLLAAYWAGGARGLKSFLRTLGIPDHAHDAILVQAQEIDRNGPVLDSGVEVELGRRELLAAYWAGGESGLRVYLGKRGIPAKYHDEIIPSVKDMAGDR